MQARDPIRAFYEDNPRMVSSPFGGVDAFNRALFEEVLETLAIGLAGKEVLDVGCGRGLVREAVAAAGGGYTGCDFVVSGGAFPLVQADAAALPFENAAFDVLFCIDASEHFPNPGRAAAEFHRVLRPGGVFFLSAPNYANVAGAVKWFCERWGGYAPNSWAPFGRWQPQEHELPLTPRRVRRLYRAAGFRYARRVGYGCEAGPGLCPWMDHPRAPEAVQFRLQRFFRAVGPAIVRICPTASLHLFWRFDKPVP